MSGPNRGNSSFPQLKRHISLLVAGHRSDRLNGNTTAVARLDDVLADFAQVRIDRGVGDQIFTGPLYEDSDCTVRVLTGRCDGVDQAAQKIARRLGLELQLIDAGSLDHAAKDLSPESASATCIHLGCPAETLRDDDSAFGLRDEFALLHADVLVAVWDGDTARGEAGGVVRLIRQAVLAGVPVLWIDLEGTLRELDRTAIDAETEFVLSQLLWRKEVVASFGLFKETQHGSVTGPIRQWLNPLIDGAAANGATSMLRTYADERQGPTWWERRAGRVDQIMSALFGTDTVAKALKSDAMKQWDAPGSLKLPAALERRFFWSDLRATIAAGRHRSTVWILYLMAAMAVLAAVAGFLHVGVSSDGWTSYIWSGVEALVLITIVLVWRTSDRKNWHAKWLGQRLMAEELRYLGMTRPFLGLPASFSEPLFAPAGKARKLVLRSAEAWLLRRALITEGPQLDGLHYDLHMADHEELAGRIKQIAGKQLGYHENKARKLHSMHHRMHTTAKVLFWLSVAAVALHLFVVHSDYLLFATAFFPALAASLHGIQTKLEIARTEDGSRRAHASLTAIHGAINQHPTAPHEDAWQCTLYLRTAALRAANIMSDQAESWRALIAQQKSDLP